MKRNIKVVLLSSLVLFGAVKVFAADATVTFVKGKVEVLKGTEWVALNTGDELKKSDIVNTGFQSEAKIKLFDSVMYLGPVTRISLDELSSSQGQDKVNVYLKTGNVRSQVNHTETKRVNYQVRTAVAVASVRGTDWEIDDSNNVSCYSGAVAAAAISALTDVATMDMETSTEVPDDGAIVSANQTLKVSDTDFSIAPVNSIVQDMNEVTSAVVREAEKESVAPATVAVPVVNTVPEAVDEVQLGNLFIKLNLPKKADNQDFTFVNAGKVQ